MNARRAITALGSGITVFLVVAAAVIEVLDFEFSALIGLPIGLIAGIVAVVVVILTHDDISDSLRWGIAAVAGFGYGILATVAASYVNLFDTQFETRLIIGGIAAVLAVGLVVFRDRER
jgi:hypothetical protein